MRCLKMHQVVLLPSGWARSCLLSQQNTVSLCFYIRGHPPNLQNSLWGLQQWQWIICSPEQLWMPYPWKCSRGDQSSLAEWKGSLPMAGDSNQVVFKLSSNPNYSILYPIHVPFCPCSCCHCPWFAALWLLCSCSSSCCLEFAWSLGCKMSSVLQENFLHLSRVKALPGVLL